MPRKWSWNSRRSGADAQDPHPVGKTSREKALCFNMKGDCHRFFAKFSTSDARNLPALFPIGIYRSLSCRVALLSRRPGLSLEAQLCVSSSRNSQPVNPTNPAAVKKEGIPEHSYFFIAIHSDLNHEDRITKYMQ